jgi:hypothetical protein
MNTRATKDKQELIPALPNFYILNYGENEDGIWIATAEPIIVWHVRYSLVDEGCAHERLSAQVEPITANGEACDDWAILNPNGSVSLPADREFDDIDVFRKYLKDEDKARKGVPNHPPLTQ